ncbi:MAG: hypothetical protein LBN25_01075, partial [Christensenellaceae bacterium]|nr:hypothetical protein [Christensenellaceae bacterium]
MKGRARVIAFCGLGAALSLAFETLAFFVPVASLTFHILAASGVMLPLTQKYYKESLISYAAASGIGAIYMTVYILPFVLVTGLFTILALTAREKNVKRSFVYIGTVIYASLTFFFLFFLTKNIVIDTSKIAFLDAMPYVS